MLSGQRFRLLRATLGIQTNDGDDQNRVALHVPAGELVTVVSGPRPDDKRMVDVLWHQKKLVMFYEDIQSRGERVVEEGA